MEDSLFETPENVDDTVILPIGIEKDGERYNKVVIDELSGVDEQLLSDKRKTGGNNAKGMTLILARSIQEIDGLIERKKNPDSLIDVSLVRNMYQIDRDFLFSRIQILTGNDETKLTGQCPRCRAQFEQDVKVSERKVIEWDRNKPCYLEFDLPRGYYESQKNGGVKIHKKGKIRFPTGADQELLVKTASDNIGRAMTAMIAACILELGELEHIDQQMAARLKSRDRKYLMEKVIRDQSPGIKSWELVTCYECGYPKVEATVDLTGFFG